MLVKEKVSQTVYKVLMIYWHEGQRFSMLSDVSGQFFYVSQKNVEVIDDCLNDKFYLLTKNDQEILIHWALYDVFISKGKDFDGVNAKDIKAYKTLILFEEIKKLKVDLLCSEISFKDILTYLKSYKDEFYLYVDDHKTYEDSVKVIEDSLYLNDPKDCEKLIIFALNQLLDKLKI